MFDPQEVLDNLKQHGADLSKPAELMFFMYLPKRRSAELAAEELREKGFKINVRRAPTKNILERLFGPRSYSCIAEIRAVPEESWLIQTVNGMVELAARYHGEYDGWESSVET